jgi:hypothetical protein
VVWTKFNQNKTRVELKDYSVGEYLGAIRISEDKRDVARRRYDEMHQAYRMRFGESYDPADGLYDQVGELDHQKDIEFKNWQEEWFADNRRTQLGCTLLWFVICGVIFGLTVLVNWFWCSVLNRC